mgnify:CR=1 FL=1
MKTHLTALTLFTMMTPFSEAADVTVNFAGVNTLSGQLYLAVYASEEDMKSRKAIQSQIITVHNADQKAVLADLPSGHYGVMVFQDLDGNRDLNTNLIGIPTEPYGFSTNPRVLGPPSFSDLHFSFPPPPVHLPLYLD